MLSKGRVRLGDETKTKAGDHEGHLPLLRLCFESALLYKHLGFAEILLIRQKKQVPSALISRELSCR